MFTVQIGEQSVKNSCFFSLPKLKAQHFDYQQPTSTDRIIGYPTEIGNWLTLAASRIRSGESAVNSCSPDLGIKIAFSWN